MTEQPGALAKRLVAEFMIIVLGVMVALGVDGWRESLRDRRLESEYLERLAADLDRDTLMLAARIEASSSALAIGQAAVARIRARESLEDVLPGAEPYERLLPVLGSSAAPLPNTATLDELKATGNLRLLTSPVVRQEVLAYALVAAAYSRRLENVMSRGRSPLAELLYLEDWTSDRDLLLARLVAANQSM